MIEKPFYRNEDVVKCQRGYDGKSLREIVELEKKAITERLPEIDDAHAKYTGKGRSRMLTVQKLIDYLKTQDPKACILAYEPNSDAYIEQFPDLPSPEVETVAEARKRMASSLKSWYRDTDRAEERIKQDLETVFRYAQDNDVIIRFA